MNECLYCKKSISNRKKFCCQSHAAMYNNTHRKYNPAEDHRTKESVCTKCGKPVMLNIRASLLTALCAECRKRNNTASNNQWLKKNLKQLAIRNKEAVTPFCKAVSKQKGTVGELVVAADILQKGWAVFTDQGDMSSVDIVAISPDEKRVVRIQVKSTTSTITDKSAVLSLCKIAPHYKVVYTPEVVDMFALYVYNLKKILYVGWGDLNIAHRVRETVNPSVSVPISDYSVCYTDFETVAKRNGLVV